MEVKNILFILVFFLLVGSVLAIKSGDITIISPADGVWTNQTNYTSGFNFSWVDETADYNATCRLYIGTVNNPSVIVTEGNASYGVDDVVSESTNTKIDMNHTFTVGLNSSASSNQKFYWIIKCENSTATPNYPYTMTAPRVIKQNTEYPRIAIVGIGFSNATWQATSPARMEINITSGANLYGESFTCGILNDSNGYVWASETTANNTAVNITRAAPDGEYTIAGMCKDPALNINKSGVTYYLKVDTITPVITHNSPAEDYISSVNWVLLNWSITEQNVEVISLEWDGTNASIGTGNCSGSAPSYVCTYNKTSISAKKDITYKIYTNDSASNVGVSLTRTISVDLANPTVTTIFNFTISDSVASYRILIADTTPSTCVAKVYQRNGSDTGNTLIGEFATIGTTSSNCTGTLTGSDIGIEGDFRILFNVTDGLGNSVQANKTGVYKSLYAGWNLLAYTGSVRTVYTICEEIDGCTQLSYMNNTVGSFVTYSTSTQSVNNGTTINPGDAILVYLSADADFLADDSLPKNDSVGGNITLYDTGWNTMGLTKDANISAVYNAVNSGTSTKNISFASEFEASASTFYTCKKSTNLCAGTSTLATNIPLYKGDGVWVLTDQSDNFTINRTGVTN